METEIFSNTAPSFFFFWKKYGRVNNTAPSYKSSYKKELPIGDANIVNSSTSIIGKEKIKYINKENTYIGVCHPSKVQK